MIGSLCAGTFLVTKACIPFPEHRRFIGYEDDLSFVNEANLHLILLQARQMLSEESDIDGKEEVCRSANVYV